MLHFAGSLLHWLTGPSYSLSFLYLATNYLIPDYIAFENISVTKFHIPKFIPMRFLFSAMLLVCCPALYAQQMAMPSPDSTFSIIRELQEVVVTAEKRELNPVDIPTALTVITPLSIPGENNPDLRNISGMVPNFYMQEGGLKLSTPLYIRGIGTVSGTPPVGLYVDGVPVFDKNAFVFDLYDIRQIEVLRGPQTTLYGRNSINGLINISLNAPSNRFSLRAKAGYATYNSQSYHLIADLPLNHFFSKLSFSYNKSEGYFKNKFDHHRKSNPSDSYNIRYQGNIYTPHEWKIALGVNYNNSFDGGYAYHAADSLRKDRYTVNYNSPSSYDRELLSSHFNLTKNFQKTGFRSVTSYSWSKDKQLLDADFTYLDVFDNTKKSRQDLITEEISLQSIAAKHFDWTVGTFGFYKDLTNRYIATFGSDRSYLLPMPLDQARYFNNTTIWGIAGYGQLTLKDLWPGMSLTAGIRYDYENSRLEYRDSILLTGHSAFMSYHQSESGEKSTFQAWLPKFSLLQKWNDALSFYLSIAKGYKAGGYNIIANEMTSRLLDLSYDEEKLWNYEIGMKYFSRSRKFNLNAALFYIDWKDQQIFVMGMMGPGIKNAGDARSIGGELDIRWEFLPHLTYIFSAGYSNSCYYHHLTPAYKNNRVVMAPEFTGNTGLAFRKPVKSSWLRAVAASTTITGFGTQYFDEANLLKQDPYFLWNLDFSISGKYLDLHLWGKNILDKAFFTYMLNNPVGKELPQYYNMGQSGSPARFGVSLTVKI